MKKFLPVRLVAVVACLSLVSCSVSIPDASYIDAAQEGFSNTAYPANRITGEWFNFNTGTAQYRASGGRETRIEYHFHAGGSGTVRQTSQFHRGDGKMDDGDSLVVIKAPIRWSYLSPNMWKVDVPDSSQYKVVHAEGAGISGHRAAFSFRVRYKNGRLYDIDKSRTLVPKSGAREYIDQERRRIRDGEMMPILIGSTSN